MYSLGKKLSTKYSKENLISIDEIEIYTFLFDYLFSQIFYYLSLIIIGILIHQIVFTSIYILITSTIRCIGGGYHAQSKIAGNLLTYSVFIVAVLSNIYLPNFSFVIEVFIYFTNCLFIVLLVPVENVNKHFTEKEKTTSKYKILFFIFLISTVRTINIFYPLAWVYKPIDICVIISLVDLILGSTKYKLVNLRSANRNDTKNCNM